MKTEVIKTRPDSQDRRQLATIDLVDTDLWRTRAPLKGGDALDRVGIYVVELRCRNAAYIDLVIRLKAESASTLMIPMDAQGDGLFRKVFKLSQAGKSVAAVIEPGVALADVSSVSLKRVGVWQLFMLGLSKVPENMSSPLMFFKKLRYLYLGKANITFSQNRTMGSGEAGAYTAWRGIFESSYQERRLLGATDARVKGKGCAAFLAVYVSTTRRIESLHEFLGQIERGELFSPPALLVLESAEAPLPGSLRERVERMGASIIRLQRDQSWFPVIFEHAVSMDAVGLIFIEREGRFHRLAFAAYLMGFYQNPNGFAIYTDSDEMSSDGERGSPLFKPEWSKEYLLCWNYIGATCAFRVSGEVLAVGRSLAVDRLSSYSLLLALSDTISESGVRHIPRVLFHEFANESLPERLHARGLIEEQAVADWLSVTGVCGSVEATQADSGALLRKVHYLAPEETLVSVVIPTRDNPKMLRDAVNSVLQALYKNKELIIVDNGSTSSDQLALLQQFSRVEGVTVISDASVFNFSALINQGRQAAAGEVIVLLNDDVKSLDQHWLGELAALAVQAEVGCVGAVLRYPDDTVQHGGVLLGVCGAVEHAFRHEDALADGEGFRLQLRHEVSAVTGACLAVRAEVFDQVGGLDEALAVAYNDIDFCLKVGRLGLRNLVTPHARLIHYESVTRGLDVSPQQRDRLAREMDLFLQRWGLDIERDPFYSPHLTRQYADFRMRLSD